MVAIRTVTGDGIIAHAKNAREQYEQKSREENQLLGNLEQYMIGQLSNIPQVKDKTPGVLSGEGTGNNPYLIESIEDLVWFGNDVTNGNDYNGKYVKLLDTLDFQSDLSYVNPNIENFCGYEGKLKDALTTGEGFKGIGSLVDEEHSFAGFFDGNDKTIYHCYMNRNAETDNLKYGVSFFGRRLAGELKNLNLCNIDFKLVGGDSSTYVSGISARVIGKVSKCRVAGNLQANSNKKGNVNASGITIYNTGGTIEDSCNLANISIKLTNQEDIAQAYSGGIAGNNENGIISRCYNKGNIKIEGYAVIVEAGGVARNMSGENGTVEYCFNSGKIDINTLQTNELRVGRNSGVSCRRKCCKYI